MKLLRESEVARRCAEASFVKKFPRLMISRLERIKCLLTALPKGIEAHCKLPKTSLEPVKHLLAEFTTNSLIKPLIDAPQSLKSGTSQSDHTTELAYIRLSPVLLRNRGDWGRDATTLPWTNPPSSCEL